MKSIKPNLRIDFILAAIAALSAFLNIFNIWNDTTANSYYTAAVTSMLQSFHNFFYGTLDPGGFVTVDKPPVAFWVQTAFAYIFGVHGWSVILPQALAAVGSVLLVYFLVKPTFGKTAARLASLVMACSPVAVAVSRTNNIDGLLVFALLLATWMLLKGIRNQKLSWLLCAFAMIGVAFNIKMLQAYMVLPAFYLICILAFKCGWKKKLVTLAAATVILLGISLSWAIVVDTTPQENRPYIGGSKTNSVLELVLGYNGIQRLEGMRAGGPGAGADRNPQQIQQDGYRSDLRQMPQNANNNSNDNSNRLFMQPGGNDLTGRQPAPPGENYMPEGFRPDGNNSPGSMPGGGGGSQGRGGGGMFGTGQAGPLRLFQSELSGQNSWLLPFAVFACIGLLAGVRRRKPLTAKQNEALFWLAWLLPVMAFFSVAGFFHQYYLIMLAPPIAVLAGTGWVELWKQYSDRNGWKKWLLPAGFLATLAFELYVLRPYLRQIGTGWSIGIGAAGIVFLLILLLARKKQKLAFIAAIAGMLVLLVAPLFWSATPILYGDNSMLPQAGPGQQRLGQRQVAGDGGNSGINTKLVDYLTKNNTGETCLFATTDVSTAEAYIIQTGKAVIPMGGFSGSDPVFTVEKLKQAVADKKVKYFLISSGSGFDGRGGGSSEVLDWIRKNSTEVPEEEWQASSSDISGLTGMRNGMVLYRINQ